MAKRGRPRLIRPLEPDEVSKYLGLKDLRVSIRAVKDECITEDFEDSEDVKLPFDDDSVGEMFFDNVMQFVDNFIPVMNETHRVLKPKGMVQITVPWYPHKLALSDPTIERIFTDMSFLYFDEKSDYWTGIGRGYGIKPFSTVTYTTNGPFLIAVLKK